MISVSSFPSKFRSKGMQGIFLDQSNSSHQNGDQTDHHYRLQDSKTPRHDRILGCFCGRFLSAKSKERQVDIRKPFCGDSLASGLFVHAEGSATSDTTRRFLVPPRSGIVPPSVDQLRCPQLKLVARPSSVGKRGRHQNPLGRFKFSNCSVDSEHLQHGKRLLDPLLRHLAQELKV